MGAASAAIRLSAGECRVKRLAAEPPIRLLIFVVSMSALAASAADSRSLQIHGVTGYLSEYDLSASVSGEASKGIEELSGPLNIKHVGLCTHDGPNEMLSYLARIRQRVRPCHRDAEFRRSRVQLSRLFVGILQWRPNLHRGAEPAAQAVREIGAPFLRRGCWECFYCGHALPNS
jgi:hypothetical protein